MPAQRMNCDSGTRPQSGICGVGPKSWCLRLLVPIGALSAYVSLVLPSYRHREALVLHVGCMLLLAIVGDSCLRAVRHFGVRKLLLTLVALASVVSGHVTVLQTGRALHEEKRRLMLARLGDDAAQVAVSRDSAAAYGGDATALRRLFECARDRTPGWGNAAVEWLSATGRSEAWAHYGEARRSNEYCGRVWVHYNHPLGYDVLGTGKLKLDLERRRTATAEAARAEVLRLGEPMSEIPARDAGRGTPDSTN